MQSDPIGLVGTSPGTLSTYAYVGSNPLTRIDPFGLSDINLFPFQSTEYFNDLAATSPPGRFTVGGHGSPTTMEDSNRNPLSAKDVANMILKDSRYTPNEPVELRSCNTGVDPKSFFAPNTIQWQRPNFARSLANITKTTVYAPNNYSLIIPMAGNLSRLKVHRAAPT